jgi:hypothetical protein
MRARLPVQLPAEGVEIRECRNACHQSARPAR